MAEQTSGLDARADDVRKVQAATAARREREAATRAGERLERLHRLCQQLAALGSRSTHRP